MMLTKWLRSWSSHRMLQKTRAKRTRRSTSPHRHRLWFEHLETRLAPADFSGGVHVAGGDVDGDGLAEVVTGAMAGGGPHVKVFNGATGALTSEFMAYEEAFRGGVNVAVGRVTGGFGADIITAPGTGGGPHVKVFSITGQLLSSFFAFEGEFQGGVHLATGDVNGDGTAEIIAGMGAGGRPEVRIYDGATNALLNTVAAYDAGFTGGVTVGATDVNGDGTAELITGAGEGGGPHVKIFNALTGELLTSFFAYDQGFQGGVRVAGGIGISADILTAAGPGGGPHIKVFEGPNANLVNSFLAGEGAFAGGVSVAGLGVDNSGTNALVTGAGPGGSSKVDVFSSRGQQPSVSFTAFDPAQAPSTGFNVTVTNDRVAPTVSITSPPSGQVANTNITVQGVAADNDSGVRTVEAQVDGGAFTNVAFDAGGNYSFTTSLPLDGTATGPHSVTIRVRDKGGNTATASVSFTIDRPPTVSTPIADVSVLVNAAPTVINLNNHFADLDSPVAENTIVRIETNFGPIDIRLFDDEAPQTVANFLNYVNSGRYTDTIFHRSVTDFVIQTGGFVFDESTNDLIEVETDPPVQNEFGRSNLRGTVAMAKLGDDPNSATSQFFISLKDNSSILDGQNGGFTVFGEVINDGMTVADEIAAVPTSEQDGAFGEIPLVDYVGVDFPFDAVRDNFVIVDSATVQPSGGGTSNNLTYAVVSNSNSALVSTAIVNGNLTLTYAAGQTGTSMLTVQATDQFGLSVQTTFMVTVT